MKLSKQAAMQLHAEISNIYRQTVDKADDAAGLTALRSLRDYFEPLPKDQLLAATDRKALGIEPRTREAVRCSESRAVYALLKAAPDAFSRVLADAEAVGGPKGWTGIMARIYDERKAVAAREALAAAVGAAVIALPAEAEAEQIQKAKADAEARFVAERAKAKAEAEAKRNEPLAVAQRIARKLVADHADDAAEILELLPAAYDAALVEAIAAAQVKAKAA